MSCIGHQSRMRHLGAGYMHCPICDATRHYTHASVKDWISVSSFPVWPLTTRREYVRCSSCQAVLDPAVLDPAPEDGAGPDAAPATAASRLLHP